MFNKSADIQVKEHIQRLEEQYKDVFDKYPAIINYMTDEVIYPKCLRTDKEFASDSTHKLLWRLNRDYI